MSDEFLSSGLWESCESRWFTDTSDTGRFAEGCQRGQAGLCHILLTSYKRNTQSGPHSEEGDGVRKGANTPTSCPLVQTVSSYYFSSTNLTSSTLSSFLSSRRPLRHLCGDWYSETCFKESVAGIDLIQRSPKAEKPFRGCSLLPHSFYPFILQIFTGCLFCDTGLGLEIEKLKNSKSLPTQSYILVEESRDK